MTAAADFSRENPPPRKDKPSKKLQRFVSLFCSGIGMAFHWGSIVWGAALHLSPFLIAPFGWTLMLLGVVWFQTRGLGFRGGR